MRKGPSKLFIYCVLSLLIAIFLSYFGRGNMLLMMLVSMLFLFGFVLASICFVICKLVKRKKDTQLASGLLSILKIIMAVTIIQMMIIIPFSSSFQSHDIHKAQDFCNELVTAIETEKEKTGEYPSNIDAFLKGRGKLPRLIKKHRFYTRYNGSYTLSFVVTGVMFSEAYKYRSEHKKWEILD